MPHHRARWALALAASSAVARLGAAQDTTSNRAMSSIQLHGFLQIYYRTGDPTTRDGYRLRKADLKFSGELSPRLRWRIGFDASKILALTKTTETVDSSTVLTDVAVDSRSRIVQDAALTLLLPHAMRLDVGQQIIPLSLEGTVPSSQIETIERTLFIVERSRATGLGDIRDIGASLNGTAADAIEYHLGLFNETGESQNTTDPNDQKAVLGRVALHIPGMAHFQVGGSGGFQGGPPAGPQRRERAGGEIQYRDQYLTLRTELMSARDAALRRFGWYSLASARPTEQLQFVARIDSWDRDLHSETALTDAYERQIVAGTSYLFDGGVGKVAFNLVRQTFPRIHTVPAATFALIAFQGVW